ncbi:hypothetical protein JTE90_017208 [Oedothorax gibbosus]|uniref:Uncharacterized protein n=1 Tax=Oedothorax gibbosus TaxID=931172 RepID=A0AAV6TPJ2_9ARAC|nr:hypothetical protein JTE90_017208 [Oedothorax gibbosus]
MTDNKVCKDATDSDNIVTEKKPRIDVNPEEKLSNKANQIERETKNLNKYVEAHQNKLSSNNETIYLNVELPPNHTEVESFRPIDAHSKTVENITSTETIATRISSVESLDDSKKYSYCCTTLSESGIAAAKFSIFISIVLLLISAQRFFKSSEEEDNTTKMFLFSVCVYALCYLHCARKLIYGIEKEMRDKFLAWFGFSIVSIFLLFSGAICLVVSSWVS